MYMFVSEQDRKTKRKVSDKYVDEEFQQALKYDPSLMIEEQPIYEVKWFKPKIVGYKYTIYHETPAFDGSAYQARLQLSGSGDKRTVIAYLHGIVNGAINRHSEDSLKLQGYYKPDITIRAYEIFTERYTTIIQARSVEEAVANFNEYYEDAIIGVRDCAIMPA